MGKALRRQSFAVYVYGVCKFKQHRKKGKSESKEKKSEKLMGWKKG